MAWARVERVGGVTVKPTDRYPDLVDVTFSTGAATQYDEWIEYFNQKAVDLDLDVRFQSFGMDGDTGMLRASKADFESAVGLLDEAFDFANDQYEQNVLPALIEEKRAADEARETAARSQAELDARAAKLERPKSR